MAQSTDNLHKSNRKDVLIGNAHHPKHWSVTKIIDSAKWYTYTEREIVFY